MNIANLDSETIDRIIEMAWEDRTPFEAITPRFFLDITGQPLNQTDYLSSDTNHKGGGCPVMSGDFVTLQFGLQEEQVIALMRREMKESSFKMWRERVCGRKTKHLKRRDFVAGRFHSQNQKG